MTRGYHSRRGSTPDFRPGPEGYEAWDHRLAIRRHTDRCFFTVEEVVPEGYIVDGVLIGRDEVAEVIEKGASSGPTCR